MLIAISKNQALQLQLSRHLPLRHRQLLATAIPMSSSHLKLKQLYGLGFKAVSSTPSVGLTLTQHSVVLAVKALTVKGYFLLSQLQGQETAVQEISSWIFTDTV